MKRRIDSSAIGILLLALLGAGAPGSVSGQVFSEFPIQTITSSPARITLGPDGALWFTENTAGRIGRITTFGSMTEFVIVPGSGPDEIVAGPDDGLWFTEATNKIARMTTAGDLTEFPLADGNSPAGIASGPDGALWFTEVNPDGGRIGRISTDGEITEFPIPTAIGASPQGIAPGPDGALWFTENFGGKIGRITTGGVITEFPVPTASSRLSHIVVGPDGALWFTETSGNRIGRSTTAGAVTEFPVPTPFSLPDGIASGPDGALWFTENFGNKIGRITTDGDITEFPIPTFNGTPFGIAAEPDGAVWFTEFNGNKIGRLTTPAGVPALTISKSAAAFVVSGQNLAYTLTYGNTGSGNATGVSISDALPAGTDFVSATGGGTLSSGVVTWSIAGLNAGATGTVSFTVHVTATSGTVANSAYSIRASEVPAVTGPPVSTAVTVAGTPALTISKSAPASVDPGQNLTYTLTYGNTGSASAAGVSISDALPVGTEFVSATGGGTLSSRIVTWNVAGLNAGVTGQTVSFTVAVTATSGSVTNAAYSIQASGVPPVSGPPTTTTVTPGNIPSAQTFVGNFVPNPNASDSSPFPAPSTAVDLASPASFAGNLTTATFGWSAPGCPSALKIKFFRPSGQNLLFLAERGPFASSPATVALSPPVPIQPGDLIGITRLTNCGNPVGAFPGPSAGEIAFAGDVSSTVARSAGIALGNFTLAVGASGAASECVGGIVVVVASIPGVPPALFKTGFQMHNPTVSVLAGRLVFHPQGVAGSGADPSLAFSLAAGQTQAFDDLLPAMGLTGPRIGSLDIVMPIGAPAPVVAVRIFNDGGAAGTTGFTMSAVSPDSILQAGDRGVLFTPPDTLRFRMNIGVRTGPSGAAMTLTRRNAAGTVVQTLAKIYAPTFFEQISAAEFLAGAPFGASDSITIQVTAGSATVYGITADNTTQDPSIQFAARIP